MPQHGRLRAASFGFVASRQEPHHSEMLKLVARIGSSLLCAFPSMNALYSAAVESCDPVGLIVLDDILPTEGLLVINSLGHAQWRPSTQAIELLR